MQEFTWSGTIVDFEPVGAGIAGYPNGDTYEGAYYDGKRNSLGKYTFSKKGATYEGNYLQNQRGGYGILNYPDKSIYQGSFITSFISRSHLEIRNQIKSKCFMKLKSVIV